MMQDKNGREVRVGDIVEWEAQAGHVVSVALEYSDWRGKPVLWVRLSDGKEAPLFESDLTRLDSRAVR